MEEAEAEKENPDLERPYEEISGEKKTQGTDSQHRLKRRPA